MGDVDDSRNDAQEAFVGRSEGDLGDGVVVDDLDDEDVTFVLGADDDESSYEDEHEPQDDVADLSLHRLEQHKGEVMSVACHPTDPFLIASGDCNDKAYLWKADTGGVTELSAHTDSVSHVRFNSSGALLATGGVDGRVVVWRTADGGQAQCLEGPGDEIEWLSWHPRGDVVLVGSADYTAWMWNAQTGACMQVFSGHSGAVRCGGFTPDGRGVVTGSSDGSVRVWSARSGECTGTVREHGFHEAGLTCVGISADSAVALTGGEDGSLRLSNLSSARMVGVLQGHEDSVEGCSFVPELGLAASCGLDGRLIVWDPPTQSMRLECRHPQQVVRMALHPSSPLAATACLDGVVRVWDLRTGACSATLTGHRAGVQDVQFTADGMCIVSGGDDDNVLMFRL